MRLFDRGAGIAAGVLALLIALPAGAQENLDQGKTAAQLFASDCAICHKTPRGLAKNAGLFGLDGFLRQHYTASRESAAAISKYLEAMGDEPSPPAKRSRRSTSKTDKGKSAEKKPAEAKSDDVKSKASDAKAKEAKPAEAKAEPKAESKSEPKTEAKSETKPETKSEAKPEAKPEAKAAAEKPAKPD